MRALHLVFRLLLSVHHYIVVMERARMAYPEAAM